MVKRPEQPLLVDLPVDQGEVASTTAAIGGKLNLRNTLVQKLGWS